MINYTLVLAEYFYRRKLIIITHYITKNTNYYIVLNTCTDINKYFPATTN
jgi:hypothetical protein